MKKLLLLLSLFLLVSTLFADYIEIGNGEGYEPAQGPFYNYYKCSHAQTLYFSEELGGANTFTSLSFELERMSANYPELPNFTVKILAVELDQFTDGAYYDMTGATEVFSETVYQLATDIGWFDIDITDFDYDGTSDLIIDVEFGLYENYDSTYYRNFKTASPGIIRMLEGHDDETYPATFDTAQEAYSNIRFNYFIEGAPGSPVNPMPESSAHTVALTPELSWDFGADTESYDLILDSVYPPAALVVENAAADGTGATYTITETLEYQTTYYWRVVSRNSNTRLESYGPIWSFTTLYAPVEEDFESNDFTAHDWQFEGGNWAVDATNAYSAYHSATSGAVSTGTTTSIFVEKEVTDNGEISFAHRSIMAYNSSYNFYMNDELMELPEELDWTYVTYPVTAGSYTFKWELIATADNDQVWLDYINFPPTTVYDNDLAMRGLIGAQFSTAGNSETYHVTIKNIGNLDQADYSVRLMQEGDVELATIDASETLIAGDTAEYDLVWDIPLEATEGETNIWAEVVFAADENPNNNIGSIHNVYIYAFGTSVILSEGFEGGSTPAGWIVEYEVGDTDWIYENGGHNGSPADAHSGDFNALLYHGSSTEPHTSRLISPEMNLGSSSPGALEFWHTQKLWASDQDELKILYKNTPNGAWQELVHYTESIEDWTMDLVELPNPSTTYYIAFEGIAKYGYGVCVDDVLVTGIPIIYDNDLSATILDGPSTINAGGSYVYNLTVKNVGTITQNSYTIKLFTNTDSEIASLDITSPIAEEEEVEHSFVWNVADDYAIGTSSIYAKVVLAGDENPGNNQTPNFTITTYPVGYNEVSIGNGNESNNRIPLCFQYKNSLSESIYFEDEMNSASTMGGIIESLTYYNNFTNNITNAPIKIWLGHTDLESLEAGWIPSTDLTMVYDNTMSYSAGNHDVTIDLETPFLYEGGNLVVMVLRPFEDTIYEDEDSFYVTQTVEHMDRTRYERDNEVVCDPENPPEGYSFDKFANVKFVFTMGATSSIEGYIYSEGNTPLAGAEVLIEESGRSTFTDGNGMYILDGVLPASYTVTASAFGYENSSENVTVGEEETVTQDFTLAPLGVVTVSGQLVTSDNPDTGVADNPITLSGYQLYETTTDASGNFSFTGVYVNHTYNLFSSYEGYVNLNMEVAVEDAEVDLEVVTMLELTFPVSNIVAVQADDESLVDLSWNSPGGGNTEFRYDDGSFHGSVGDASEGANAVFGAIHTNNAVLNSMTWYLDGTYYSHSTVNLYILGLDSNNRPDRDNVLFTATQIPNTDDEWNEYSLPEDVVANEGFFIGICTPNIYLSIGLDDGAGAPYEFTSGTQMFSTNWNDSDTPWQDLGDLSPNYAKNFMIRAQGMNFGELRNARNEKGINLNAELSNDSNLREDRELIAYNVYRFPAMYQNDPEQWDIVGEAISDTIYTDTSWISVDPGNYRFAIKAVYTNEIESIPSFSNIVEKTFTDGENPAVPAVTRMNNNYPNPFNPSTTISFSLKEDSDVTLRIYNVKGELVNTLVNQDLTAGNHNIVWEGKDSSLRPVASGVYFYKMKAGRYTSTKKMILMK